MLMLNSTAYSSWFAMEQRLQLLHCRDHCSLLIIPQYPFESLTIDLLTHLTASDHGHNVIYIVVDRLSRFMHFIPCKHTVSAVDLAEYFLANVLACHGMPALIVSNHDLRFTSYF